MEEGIILLLILFLIFNVGIGEISFPNISKENIEIEEEKITGNANINVKSNTGDIHILFEERLLGNPNISLQTNTGNIVFYNDRNTIRKFNINVNAVKIKYNKKDSANIFD